MGANVRPRKRRNQVEDNPGQLNDYLVMVSGTQLDIWAEGYAEVDGRYIFVKGKETVGDFKIEDTSAIVNVSKSQNDV